MKKLFNHTKKPYQKWEEYDRENYDWDEMEDIEDVEYDASAEEEGAYYADGEYEIEETDGEYYAEEAEEEYYAEEGDMTDAVATGAYVAEGAGGEEDSYYAEEDGEEYYAEEEAEYEEEYYAEEEYYEEEKKVPPVASKKNSSKKSNGKKKAGGFAVLWAKFLDMGAMDRIVLATGVGVLVLALITGSVYASARMLDKQVSGFVSVGTQLEGIDLIGEQGLLAVADAHAARIAAANSMEHNSSTEYDEEDYNAEVTVGLDLVSVQKDLKIKFTNQRNDKLVANVPFVVTVEDPSGNTENWSDDDMDGIIYKKGLNPGRYQITVNPIEDAKYDRYTLPVITETTEVKKEIEYTKIDVKNEIKAETEVNAAKEDTKKNETVVESKLEDTVKWVESTVVSNTYKEVPKSSIADPLTVVSRSVFMRMSSVGSVTGNNPGATATPTPSVTNTPVPADTPTPTPVATATPTPVATATPTPSATPTVTPTPTPTPVPVVTAAKDEVKIAAGSSITVETTVTGFDSSKKLDYFVESSDTTKATVTVDDATGKITINGVAVGSAKVIVKVDYEGNNFAKAASDSIAVTVNGDLSISLDKSALTVLTGASEKITASIGNAITSTAVTAESSDTNVATVSVDGKTVTVTGVKAGSATIVVKYSENGAAEVKASCAVTVKTHPQNDTNTRLKDTSGTQLYVLNGNTYREATYADYYSATKFFVKGDPKYTGWQTLNGKVYFFDSSYQKVTGEQIIQGAKYNFASDGSLMTGSGTMGIDVSKWNGTIDWSAVKNSGISYVIIRSGYRGSSQGALIEDPKFVNNIKGATAAGLKVGIYFFTQAVDEVEAVEEASMVLEQVKGYKISYPIFLDVEPSGGRADGIDKETRTAVIKAFCKTIEDAGYTAGVYANKTWLDSKINASELSAYKIWLAQYAKEPTYTGRYDLWQYSSTGKVTGISGNVDLNQSYLGY